MTEEPRQSALPPSEPERPSRPPDGDEAPPESSSPDQSSPALPYDQDVLFPDAEAELKRTQNQLKFEMTRRVQAERERDRLLVAEREQRLMAETLREVADALSSNIDHRQVLILILDKLARMVDYDSTSIMMVAENSLDVAVRQGGDNQLQEFKLPEISLLPHVEEVLRHRNPVIIPNTTSDPRWKSIPDTGYILSWLGVPLIVKDKVIGLLNLNKEEPDYYNERDAELAAYFANHAAIAIENARLFEDTRERVRRLAALREIDMAITASLDLRVTLKVLLDQVIITLQVDAAAVLLLNPLTQMLDYTASRGFHSELLRRYSVRLNEGYAGRAAMDRATISVPDLSKEPASLTPAFLPAESFAAYFAIPLIAKGQVKGVLEVYHRQPLYPDPEWLAFLETMAGQAAIAIDNAVLFNDLQRSNTELSLAYDTTLEGWARALELRDKETEGHTQRVTETTLALARAFGMSDSELVHVRRGALLHDIGKMGIPDSILLKPGPLTEEEWGVMRMHPLYAYEMLSPISYLRAALDIPYCHHERWDGTGYPRGLVGDQIPLAARIFAVADVWDAMLSDRPYRSEFDDEEALAYLEAQGGKHFDPEIVQVFIDLVNQGLIE